jgi:hypothetical protein
MDACALARLGQADFATRSKSLERWHGEDYGWPQRNKMVTLVDMRFLETNP